jgi:stage V sporulation protein AA
MSATAVSDEQYEVYIRFKMKGACESIDHIKLSNLATFYSKNQQINEKLSQFNFLPHSLDNQGYLIIDTMEIIAQLKKWDHRLNLQVFGAYHIMIKFKQHDKNSIVLFLIVWLVLFFGAGLTMINFHSDVNMGQVHEEIVYLFTGEKIEKPLLLQIPYSIGIGVGMFLFFHQPFKRKKTPEPSPLEIELFLYQQNLENYLLMKEEEKSLTIEDFSEKIT